MAQLKVVIKLNDSDNTTIEVNKGFVSDLSSLIQSTSDPSILNYEILANSGKLDIVDSDKRIKNLIEQKGINAYSIGVDVYINNTKKQEHIVETLDYDVDESVFSMSLTNKVKILEDEIYSYPVRTNVSLYDIIVEYTGNNITGGILYDFGFTQENIEKELNKTISATYENEYLTVKRYLKAIIIPFIKYDNQTKTGILNDISEISQINFIIDDSGELRIVSMRPVVAMNELNSKAIHIPTKNIYSSLKFSPIAKGNIDGIKVSQSDFVYIDYMPNYETWEGLSYSTDTIDLTDWIKGGASNSTLLDFLKNQCPQYSFMLSNHALIGVASSYPNEFTENVVYIKEKSGLIYSRCVMEQNGTLVNSFSTSAIEKHGQDYQSISSFATFVDGEIDGVNTNSILWFDGRLDDSQHDLSLKNKTTYLFAVALDKIKQLDSFTFRFSYGIPADVYKRNDNNIVLGGSLPYESLNNLLMQGNTTYDGEPIVNVLYNTITKDYKSGVRVAKTTLCCTNLYYSDNSIAKNFNIGETLSVGDIVYFTNDTNIKNEQRYWLITSVEFYYDSAPYINIEMVEANPVEITYPAGLYESGTGNVLYTWDELKNNGYISVIEGTISSTSGKLNGDLVLSSEISEVGESAFYEQTGLTSIFIPNTVKSLNSSCFYKCTSLINIDIPDGVTTIGDTCFAFCSSLENIKIGKSIQNIGNGAFSYCYNIKKIYYNAISSGDLSGPNNIFLNSGTNAGYDIVFGDDVTHIPAYLFNPQKSGYVSEYKYKSVTLGKSVTSIGASAFEYGTDLYLQDLSQWCDMVLPTRQSSPLGGNIYINNVLTKELVIPEGVSQIRQYAFYGSKITSVIMPSSINYIGWEAFYGCSDCLLYDFSMSTSIPTLGDGEIFGLINKNCKIVVPDELFNTWRNSSGWATYWGYIIKASEV